jgi:hypothetical protein
MILNFLPFFQILNFNQSFSIQHQSARWRLRRLFHHSENNFRATIFSPLNIKFFEHKSVHWLEKSKIRHLGLCHHFEPLFKTLHYEFLAPLSTIKRKRDFWKVSFVSHFPGYFHLKLFSWSVDKRSILYRLPVELN